MNPQKYFGLLIGILAMAIPIRTAAGEESKTGGESARATFRPDLTRGEVRLVLMNVGQTKVFPNERDLAEKHPVWKVGKQGVPAFTATFLIETLGDGPVSPKVLKRLEILQGGEPIRLRSQGGEYQEWFDYHAFPGFLDFRKPKVSNENRAFIMRYVRFGTVSDVESFSLRIRAGFGDNVQEFMFNSIDLLGS